MIYRKKPILVEAEQWGPPVHAHDEYDYILPMGVMWKGKEKKYFIEGQEIEEGDYILFGVQDQKHHMLPKVIKKEEFQQTYELVPEQPKKS